MRARRQALSERQRLLLSGTLSHQFAATPVFRRSRRIACYLPNDGEIDLTPLIHRIWSLHKRCYLPVLDTLSSNRLWFTPYRPGERLVYNRYGIPEPGAPARTRAAPWSLDLVLAPLVAFDPRGNRLGMGGGYYDRTLAFLRRRNRWHKPIVLGVAYEFQRVASLPPRAWDVPMHGIVTEAGLTLVMNRSSRK